jgi:hypothetical protein
MATAFETTGVGAVISGLGGVAVFPQCCLIREIDLRMSNTSNNSAKTIFGLISGPSLNKKSKTGNAGLGRCFENEIMALACKALWI